MLIKMLIFTLSVFPSIIMASRVVSPVSSGLPPKPTFNKQVLRQEQQANRPTNRQKDRPGHWKVLLPITRSKRSIELESLKLRELETRMKPDDGRIGEDSIIGLVSESVRKLTVPSHCSSSHTVHPSCKSEQFHNSLLNNEKGNVNLKKFIAEYSNLMEKRINHSFIYVTNLISTRQFVAATSTYI